jgi:hypothetical protein
MTIARDITTGQVVGQMLAADPAAHKGFSRWPLLTKDGPKWVPSKGLRLEHVSDK